jgi:hypothetical protein
MDRREAILSRIFALLDSVSGIPAYRNRGNVLVDKRPALVLLDGIEDARDDLRGRGRPSHTPNVIIMRPEIYIALRPQLDNEGVGEELNALRGAILKLILTDATLAGLHTRNGEIFYNGCLTDLAQNEPMDGLMSLLLLIAYPFMPEEL